jgi:hypothetical protein
MDRELEMKICLLKQGYMFVFEDNFCVNLCDHLRVMSIIEEEKNGK